MIREKRKNAVKGPFSLTLLKAITSRLERGEQTLISAPEEHTPQPWNVLSAEP